MVRNCLTQLDITKMETMRFYYHGSDIQGEQGRGIVASNYSVLSLKDKWRKLPQKDKSNVQNNDDWRVHLLPVANCPSGLTKE